ncbi:hypothetical protein AC578_9715 [Pseudocercospora eumusae]|uniref:Uncharacterized protein n=1 Tax=Pseudocercospora eumusae TaxID=321146 RepID=A0A139HQR8_9PEZI|nr:hypothetical protein AC578_9715 [Pseudocercospora eumusae]
MTTNPMHRNHSQEVVQVQVRIIRPTVRRHSLRRKSSPIGRTLRDLHQGQADRRPEGETMRQMLSDEALRRKYEGQELAYLNSAYNDLEGLEQSDDEWTFDRGVVGTLGSAAKVPHSASALRNSR